MNGAHPIHDGPVGREEVQHTVLFEAEDLRRAARHGHPGDLGRGHPRRRHPQRQIVEEAAVTTQATDVGNGQLEIPIDGGDVDHVDLPREPDIEPLGAVRERCDGQPIQRMEHRGVDIRVAGDDDQAIPDVAAHGAIVPRLRWQNALLILDQ